ncbi:YceD family protein [Flaviflexus huanghaiensis]|uniref:YceD family protein n=1 Tax=Flaviflexus huanghaiensis TaxID=1111473 RepID=UPI0015FA704D|nr:YceD family protein [Flaviflexus huanghaiensis]
MSDAFRISLADLRRQEGSRLEFVRSIPAPDTFATALVRTIGDISVDGALQSVSEGVLVTGTVDYTTLAECARCLREVEEDLTSDVTELYFYPNRAKALQESGDEEAEEVALIEDDTIDIEPLLRDTIVGQMPFIPLCDENCPGLCAVCGGRLADLPDDHAHEEEFQEMTALDELRAKLAAEEQGS